MSASNAELVQVRYEKLKNINFVVSRISHSYTHVHSCLELGVVLDGSARIYSSDESFLAEAGALLLFNAYEDHTVAPLPEATVLFMQLSPSFGKEYFARMASVEFEGTAALSQAEKQQILQPILSAAMVFFRKPEAFGMECAGFVALAVTAMLRMIPYRLNSDADYVIKKKKIGRQQRIASFVEQHYREKLTLSHLAKSEGITTTYMSRMFGELFNMPFQAYLSQFRLQKAIPMLKNPSIYLVDICMECGFSDTRYLNAVCQKEYGCTASRLREQMQDENWVDPKAEYPVEFTQYDDEKCLQILQSFVEKNL